MSDFSDRMAGGIGTYVHILAQGLSSKGHEVIVFSPNCTGRSKSSYAVIPLGDGRSHGKGRLELSLLFLDAVRRLHAQAPLSIVEATDWGMEGFHCVHAREFPTVVRMHTPHSLVTELNGGSRRRDAETVAGAEAEYFNSARYFSAPSAAVAKLFRTRYAVPSERITVIPNPYSIERSKGDLTDASLARSHFRIVFFGRLERRKGVYVLAEALRSLLNSYSDVEVEFIGPDTRRANSSVGKELQASLSAWRNRIRFRGHLKGAEKYAALRLAHCIVLPSLWENFPYACLEAMASERPVIATSGSGFEEIIEPGCSGVLVPPDNPAMLAGAMLDVMEGRYPGLGTSARKRVRDFDAPKIVSRIENFYREIITRHAT
ncbi:MAG: glycosyltransferase family 4 protein [Candidatus Nealsonbacteria bacterium]|nr:glycosyltransferase family 4 protein [Candidatus Nealsonbacteria bacterium]